MISDRLVYMANQVATFFAHLEPAAAAAATADHLTQFWEPRMRARIITRVRQPGDSGLSPLARAAVDLLEVPSGTHA